MDFTKVRAVHTRALKRLAELRAAKTFSDYEDTNKDLLGDIQAIWNKTVHMLKKHKHEASLLAKYRHDRDHDALLAYVKAARNCDEHTIADVSRREPGIAVVFTQDGRLVGLGLDAFNGPGPIHVGAPILNMAAIPSRAIPLAITDQRSGKVYDPPATHLGRAIPPQLIEDWLRLCLNYYDQMLSGLLHILTAPEHT